MKTMNMKPQQNNVFKPCFNKVGFVRPDDAQNWAIAAIGRQDWYIRYRRT